MSNNMWPEAFGISAVAASVAWIFTPWDKVGPINWNAVSALATVAAVLVALGMPLWQHIRRVREADHQKFLENWIVATESFKQIRRLHKVAKRVMAARNYEKSAVVLADVHRRFETISGRAKDLAGIAITADARDASEEVLGYVRNVMKSSTLNPLGTIHLSFVVDDISDLQDRAELWLWEVIRQGERLGAQMPDTVPASS